MTICGIKNADGVCVMGECPYIKKCCPVVWDKSKVPTTNEEYIKALDTEQLADVLLHIADSCYWEGFFKGKDDDDYYDDEYCLINQNIVEWLKQPHTPKE